MPPILAWPSRGRFGLRLRLRPARAGAKPRSSPAAALSRRRGPVGLRAPRRGLEPQDDLPLVAVDPNHFWSSHRHIYVYIYMYIHIYIYICINMCIGICTWLLLTPPQENNNSLFAGASFGKPNFISTKMSKSKDPTQVPSLDDSVQ